MSFSAILVLLHPTSGFSEIHFYFEIPLRSLGLLTNRVKNELEKSNLINEHVLNHEPVPLISTES